jgi:hypothetical protein
MPLLNGIDSSKYLIIEFLGVYELLNIDFWQKLSNKMFFKYSYEGKIVCRFGI